MHFKSDAGEGVFETPLYKRYGEVCNVDSYPFPFELLRRVDCGAATAKRV